MKSIAQKYLLDTTDTIIVEEYDMYGKFYINVDKKPKISQSSICQMRNAFNYITTLLDKFNITFFLTFGTCLGAVRQSDFIENDGDLDIGVYYNQKDILFDFLGALIQNNDFKIYKICVNETCLSVSYKNNIVIDIGIFDISYNKHFYSYDNLKLFKKSVGFLYTLDELYFIGGGAHV